MVPDCVGQSRHLTVSANHHIWLPRPITPDYVDHLFTVTVDSEPRSGKRHRHHQCMLRRLMTTVKHNIVHAHEPAPKKYRLCNVTGDMWMPQNPSTSSEAEPQRIKQRLKYAPGIHLAPMVRSGTLPTRLIALDAGATLVWGPEIVDRAIIGTTRHVDAVTGTVRFVKEDGRPVWECHPLERDSLIFQIGTADPDLAVQAAKLVQNDVAGIGLNCGCPLPFSTSGGKGAALLQTPDLLCSILEALVRETHVPIDCKIRILPDHEQTRHLVDRIKKTGISCLTVHCRTPEMRNKHAPLSERIKPIVAALADSDIPVVYNGRCHGPVKLRDTDVSSGDVLAETGASAVMIAEAAEDNPTCFSDTPASVVATVLPKYLRIAALVDQPFSNAKFCMAQMEPARCAEPPPKARIADLRRNISTSKSYDDVARALGVPLDDVHYRDAVAPEAAQALLRSWLPALCGRMQSGQQSERAAGAVE